MERTVVLRLGQALLLSVAINALLFAGGSLTYQRPHLSFLRSMISVFLVPGGLLPYFVLGPGHGYEIVVLLVVGSVAFYGGLAWVGLWYFQVHRHRSD